MEIKLPKDINTIEKLNAFLEPTNEGSVQVYTKRTGKYCFHFTVCAYSGKVSYLMDDGVSVGKCKFENLNKYLKFIK